ncbi:MAG TPA: hypothetical protein VJT32_02835 [bacterium]|nr:hypothetical protein [bacterium]
MRTREELELHVSDLEGLLEELVSLVDDPDLTDAEFRADVRELVSEEDADE